MAEIIKIAELSIDNKKLIKTLDETKKQIDKLTQSQADLKKAGDTSSQAFAQNEASLKKLTTQYNEQNKVLAETSGANKRLNDALSKNVKTTEDATANTKELTDIKKNLNLATEDGAKAYKDANSKIEENNKLIDDNTSKVKNNTDGVKGTTGALGKAKGAVTAFGTALKAIGIGLIIAAVVKLGEAFSRNQKVVDAFNKVMTVVGAVFDAIVSTIVNTVSEVSKMTGGFDALGKVIGGLITLALTPLKLQFYGLIAAAKGVKLAYENMFGDSESIKAAKESLKETTDTIKEISIDAIEAGKDIKNNLGEAFDEVSTGVTALVDNVGKIDFKKVVNDAKALADVKRNIEAIIIAQEGLVQKYEREAELLRQTRDDTSKSIAERLKASKDLSAKLDEQAAAERALIGVRLSAAEQEAALNKGNIDLQNEILRIKNEALALDNKITGQKSEQITSELGLEAERLAIIVGNAQIELDSYIAKNQSKIDSDTYFNDESLRLEQERLDAITEKQNTFAALQLANGIINQTEYNARIDAIKEENRVGNEEAELARKEAQAETDLLDAENQAILDQMNWESNFALQKQRLEEEKAQELAVAEKLGADTALIDKKYADFNKKLKEEEFNTKMQLAADAFNNIAEILGKESAAGKAAAIAAATISTIQSAVNSYNSLSGIAIVGPVLGAIAAAAALASGYANVKKIASTPKPEVPTKQPVKRAARGGKLVGASHTQGGIPFSIDGQSGFEAEGGETVINKRSSSMYGGLLSAINQAGGGVAFADGGSIGSIASRSNSASLLDYDLLAEKISESNASMPAPRVSVDEINTVSNNVSVIEASSEF